jgi:hypothetical protein
VAASTAHAQFFPTNNASWQGTTLTLVGPQPFQEVLCGDTLINGQVYSQFWAKASNADSLLYRVAIRVNGPRVWYIEADSTEERLLYDFSLETGDDITLPYVGLPGEATLKVASVAYVSQGNETRKVINFVPIMGIQEVWVEGVGSLFGPLNRGFIALDAYSELACQRLGGSISYSTGNAQACDFIYECLLTSTDETDRTLDIQVFPTVSEGQVQLQFAGHQQLDVVLYSAVGRRVWQQAGLNPGQHTLDFGHLPKGMYVLALSASNKNIYLQRFKLMITR